MTETKELSKPKENATVPTHWGQRVLLATVWLAILAGWIVFQRLTGRSTIETAQFFVDNVRGAWWAFGAFIVFYAFRPVMLFPASVLTIVGGMLFGPVLGVAATVIGANMSAMVAYQIGKALRARPNTAEATLTGGQGGVVQRWSAKMRSESFTTVLTMRLLYLPYDLVNYTAGFLGISPLPFIAATAIGSIPGTVAFTLAGSSIDNVDEGLLGFDWRVFAASVVLFAISLVIARTLRGRTEISPA